MDAITSTSHERAILRCKPCKAAGTVAYTVTRTTRAFNGRPHTTQTVTIDGRNRQVRDRYDVLRALARPCPGCDQYATPSIVKGTLVEDRTCDERCMGAVGPNCSCSCGGANHGGGHDAW